jgi:hypothetical protein
MNRAVKFNKNKLYHYVGETLEVIEAWPSLKVWLKDISPQSKNKEWQLSKASPMPDFRVNALGFIAQLETERSEMESKVAMLPISEQTERNGFYKSEYTREVLSSDWYPDNRESVLKEFKKFFDTIPERVKKLFAEWNPESAILWKALVFSAKYPEFLDLIESNSNLAFALCDKRNWTLERKTPLQKLLSRKQKDLAHVVGFNSKHLGILKKIDSRTITKKSLDLIKEVLEIKVFEKTLLHCPKITPEVIAFIFDVHRRNYSHRLVPKFIHELAFLKDHCDEVEYALRYGSNIGPFYIGELVFYEWRDVVDYFPNRNPNSIQHLYKLHEEMLKDIEKNTEISLIRNNALFPPAPFPTKKLLLDIDEDTVSFEPITSSYELFLEGKEMHNCSFTYNGKIQKGQFYFYKLMGKEKCHISLKKRRSGNQTLWQLEEFKASHNKLPSKDSWKALFAWIKINRIKMNPDLTSYL